MDATGVNLLSVKGGEFSLGRLRWSAVALCPCKSACLASNQLSCSMHDIGSP